MTRFYATCAFFFHILKHIQLQGKSEHLPQGTQETMPIQGPTFQVITRLLWVPNEAFDTPKLVKFFENIVISNIRSFSPILKSTLSLESTIVKLIVPDTFVCFLRRPWNVTETKTLCWCQMIHIRLLFKNSQIQRYCYKHVSIMCSCIYMQGWLDDSEHHHVCNHNFQQQQGHVHHTWII